MGRDFLYFFWQYADVHSLIIPIGIIGIWRWATWFLKELVALRYKPEKSNFKSGVSIVVPVYNENPSVLKKAIASWKKNKPKKIIAVIDYSDKSSIKVFKEFEKKSKSLIKIVITKKPGKRPALADGIKLANTDIVALVDSDTIWDDDVIKNALPPFADKKVAGVGTYQNVLNPKTLAQKIFDVQLDLRYADDMSFMAAAGDALICLSGRTAFYRRKVITPMLPDLVNETFMGRPVISGDDKRLTYLVLAAGWKVKFQSNSRVYTPGMANMGEFLKQRLRWSRNALRADLRAIKEGWPLKHKALLFFQFDKLAQTIVTLLSPIYFAIAVLTGLWQLAILIAAWWIVSRSIKMYPHLRRRPQDILLIPAFIVFSFLNPAMKVYAFLTMNTQGWITRWDKSRMSELKFIRLVPAYAATLVIISLLALGVYLEKRYTLFIPQQEQKTLIASVLPTTGSTIAYTTNAKEVLAASTKEPRDLLVHKLEWHGEPFYEIANEHGITYENLLNANVNRITNLNRLPDGFMLNIPGKDMQLAPQNYNYFRIYPDYLGVSYDPVANMTTVSGRGITITLNDLRNSLSSDQIEEVEPGVWYLKTNLYLRSGVTLILDKKEVTWLKLKSTKKDFVFIRGTGVYISINGVKITSWDEKKKDYDRDITDGRSYIMVKDASRMDLYSSEIGYMGYARPKDLNASPYGISWKMSRDGLENTLLTGEVLNSRFHHNYFGAYTWGATGMVWRGNEFDHNIRYGLDPHDDSDGFIVENNRAHDNGTHGIIFSKRCDGNIIRNNLSYNNKLQGIMLHEKSDNNIIENNVLYGNTDGVAIYHSSNNIIRNNVIRDNKYGIRMKDESNGNTVQSNKIVGSTVRGIDLYRGSNGNLIVKNTLNDNNNAVYIKTSKNIIANNKFEDNSIGVYFLGDSTGNQVYGNSIIYSTVYGIYSKNNVGSKNYLSKNTLFRNRKEIVAKLPEGKNISEVIHAN